MSGLYGNVAGGFGMPKTFLLADENGNEITGVVVGEETVFTAELNDIRAGKTAANAEGVVTGTKDIPVYRTTQSNYYVFAGEDYSIPLSHYEQYDYTKFQGLIAKYNEDATQRMSVEQVIIDDNIYAVNSSEILSTITKNTETKSIDLNITNDTEDIYIIYYFTCKEEE